MKMKTYFLWPSGNTVNGVRSIYKFTSVAKIENELGKMFPNGHPVLCSSGRAALFMALQEMNVSRKEYVGVFPYASHCVIDTVARVTTPLTGAAWIGAQHRLVYHQWGYVQELNLLPDTIEDCVDTLCVPGTDLFTGGGQFEIWSLPKIIGTTSGGVLWCKDEETANRIKQKRDKRNGGTFQWLLRLMSRSFPSLYHYWEGAEAAYRKPSLLQTGEIAVAIKTWDAAVIDRKRKIDMVWPLAVNWLKKPLKRLPSVVPVISEIPASIIGEMGIEHSYRMMEKVKPDGTREIVKVLPIPIHQDVSEKWINETLNIIVQNVST